MSQTRTQGAYRIHHDPDAGSGFRVVRCDICERDLAIVATEREANVIIGWHGVAHAGGRAMLP